MVLWIVHLTGSKSNYTYDPRTSFVCSLGRRLHMFILWDSFGCSNPLYGAYSYAYSYRYFVWTKRIPVDIISEQIVCSNRFPFVFLTFLPHGAIWRYIFLDLPSYPDGLIDGLSNFSNGYSCGSPCIFLRRPMWMVIIWLPQILIDIPVEIPYDLDWAMSPVSVVSCWGSHPATWNTI
jgi:hypothetical protein